MTNVYVAKGASARVGTFNQWTLTCVACAHRWFVPNRVAGQVRCPSCSSVTATRISTPEAKPVPQREADLATKET